ncbi:MetQ/NlpA family ABC transporter substrate-binding protein [Anaerovorax odorimutans]|uniref:MetQ/NlpA family ABC transporter substrate-binding protein n=1 Tax=Anaerovorax odorimutans TaxID=109327 RepID=UPI000409103C|nr:MetQ/NlpA family ABC transporter substrate-binding protein [Anaerovorax odorimutans]
MKKIITILLVFVMSFALLTGCGGNKDSNTADDKDKDQLTKITVGASTTPHAEILNAVKDTLADEGYELVVQEFTDYVLPNTALNDGSLDANYFQHQPYLDDFNKEKNMDLKSVAAIHYEPFGIYPGKKKSLDEIADGDVIAVPNDTTNEARALQLLQDQGLIKLKDGVGLEATVRDITENPHDLQIKELEAALVARTLPDVDFGIINGNNALLAGLNVSKDSIASEDKESVGAQTFANVLVVRPEDVDDPKTKALVKALTSDEARKFIEDKYEGAVVPVF